jgi:hypothetical protein
MLSQFEYVSNDYFKENVRVFPSAAAFGKNCKIGAFRLWFTTLEVTARPAALLTCAQLSSGDELECLIDLQ